AGETRDSAESVIANRPARTISPAAQKNSMAGSGSGGLWPARLRLPARKKPGLQSEHLALLVGLGMVVPEQVQYAVHGQQVQLVGCRVAGRHRLGGGDLRGEHDVAEQRRLPARVLARPVVDAALVHREGEDVG